MYNTTFLNNVTSPLDLITGLGNTINQPHLFGNMTLIIFFFGFLAFAYKFNFVEVLIIDGFLTTILSILLYFSNQIVSVTAIIYPAIIFIITLVLYFFTKGKGG